LSFLFYNFLFTTIFKDSAKINIKEKREKSLRETSQEGNRESEESTWKILLSMEKTRIRPKIQMVKQTFSFSTAPKYREIPTNKLTG
jgi:hypothetical protein